MAQKTQTAMQMTAIQQAIELIKVQQSLYETGSHTWYAYQHSIDLITALLPIEREQIIDAYWGGLNGAINDYTEAERVGSEIIGIKSGGGAALYFNETYKQNT